MGMFTDGGGIPLAFSLFPGSQKEQQSLKPLKKTVLQKDDDVAPILKVSEGRWRIEECFRIMKTDFEARPTFVRLEDRVRGTRRSTDAQG